MTTHDAARAQRYADAVDSVLADDFLTKAVTRAVMAVADAEISRAKAEALREAAEVWGQSPATPWLQGRAVRYDRP